MRFLYSIIRLRELSVIPILLIGTIVSSSCFISNIFIEDFIFPKWVMFGLGTSLILILLVLSNFRKETLFNYYDILLGGIFILILLLLLFNASQFSDVENYSVFCCFCIICCLCSNLIDIQKLASISFICSAGISSIFAIYQFLEGQDLTGCYDNLVGFDIALILGILSIIYLLKFHVFKRKHQLILYFTILIFSILVVMTKSRLAIMTIMIGCTSFFPKKRWTIIISSLSILCLISYYDSKKYESTYGRSFILKTSLTLLDSPSRILIGYGEDGFKSKYMTRQSELLKSETDAVKQRASNIIHPLNEFVLMTIKYGILIPILLLTILGFVLFNKGTSLYTKAIILVFITYAFFSYPLKYPISWIVIAVALTSKMKTIRNKKQLKFTIIHSFVLLTTGVMLLVFISNSVCLNRDWKIAHTQALLGKKQQALSNYYKLSKRLKTDEFIFNYASYFHNLGKNAEASSLLSNINLVDYETTMLSGKINTSLGLHEDAIKDFCLAYEMCPNRFSPLFEIYKIYEKTNNKNGQKIYSELILNKQIKVPSPQIDYILDYVSII